MPNSMTRPITRITPAEPANQYINLRWVAGGSRRAPISITSGACWPRPVTAPARDQPGPTSINGPTCLGGTCGYTTGPVSVSTEPDLDQGDCCSDISRQCSTTHG